MISDPARVALLAGIVRPTGARSGEANTEGSGAGFHQGRLPHRACPGGQHDPGQKDACTMTASTGLVPVGRTILMPVPGLLGTTLRRASDPHPQPRPVGGGKRRQRPAAGRGRRPTGARPVEAKTNVARSEIRPALAVVRLQAAEGPARAADEHSCLTFARPLIQSVPWERHTRVSSTRRASRLRSW